MPGAFRKVSAFRQRDTVPGNFQRYRLGDAVFATSGVSQGANESLRFTVPDVTAQDPGNAQYAIFPLRDAFGNAVMSPNAAPWYKVYGELRIREEALPVVNSNVYYGGMIFNSLDLDDAKGSGIGAAIVLIGGVRTARNMRVLAGAESHADDPSADGLQRDMMFTWSQQFPGYAGYTEASGLTLAGAIPAVNYDNIGAYRNQLLGYRGTEPLGPLYFVAFAGVNATMSTGGTRTVDFHAMSNILSPATLELPP